MAADKILVDVNVFEDVFRRRGGWLESFRVIEKVRNGELSGYVSALPVPVLHFFQSARVGERQARGDVREMVKKFRMVALTERIIKRSWRSELPEFEDNIQFFSAEKAKVDLIVTRNKKHFRQQKMRVVNPDELLAMIEQQKQKPS